MPKWTYVSDVFASPRDANVVFVAFNNWQRGDYKPYLLRSDDRGRTFKPITANLPDKHDVWSVIQDHVNGNLLFAGTEFGVFASVDGGGHWTQLKGGAADDPGARHGGAEARERSRARHVRPRLLGARRLQPAARDDAGVARRGRRSSTRCAIAYEFNPIGEAQASEPTWVAPNPPVGAESDLQRRRGRFRLTRDS